MSISNTKLKKALFWTFGGIVAVLVLGWMLLVFFFPTEEIRLTLQKQASAELRTPVRVGSVRVSFWGGLGALVSDITIGDTAEEADEGLSASIEAADFKLQFWPLFRGDYFIDHLVIERPSIRIVSGLGASTDSQSQTDSQQTGSPQSGSSQADAMGAKLALGGLTFGKLEIRDGSLERLDTQTGSIITVQGIGFAGDLTDSITGKIYESEGKLQFESIVFRNQRDAAAVTVPSTMVDYLVKIDSSLNRLEVKRADVNIAAGQFSVTGEIPLTDDGESSTRLKIGGKAPLSLLANFLPGSSVTSYGGELGLDLTITGKLSELERVALEGRLTIADGSIKDNRTSSSGDIEQLEKMDAEFLIYPDRIEIKTLALQFSESDLAVTGIITNPFPYLLPVSQRIKDHSAGPYLQFEATSHRLNIDALFPEAAPGAGINRALAPPDSTPPIFLPEIKGSGSVGIDTLIYANVEFVNVRSNLRLERRRIFCENMRGLMFGGEFDGSALIDLTDLERPHYSGSYSARDLNVQRFIKRFAPWDGSGLLTGEMSASGSYAASGWRKEDFISGLTMDILSNADSLRFTSEKLSNTLTSAIKSVSGASIPSSEYKTLDLRSFKGQLRFVGGKLQVDTLRGISSTIGRWKLHGAVDLDGSMSLSGTLVPTESLIRSLTPKNSLAGAVAGLLRTSPQGSISIPFTISGSAEKPVFAIDGDALGEALNKTLKRDGASILKGLFKK